ncbi:MAG: SOS response-associated peptidase [Gammaproteobacteria bacterium]|nr:SOS response-associated peptidase [Gammaproteobacteria bacterium]
MCGRFNVISDPVGRLILEITGRGFVVDTRYNIAPTEDVPVILERDGEWDVRDMRWWLVPHWSDGPSSKYAMFNAKSETLEKSRAYREPFARRRCIVPGSGYYEWRKEGSGKVPYYMTPEDGSAFAFAALWDCWKGEHEVIESCTIVTTDAPESMASIHDRMPVHLTSEQAKTWVDAGAETQTLKDLLAPTLRMPITITPVSTIVNNARNKDERCLEPIGEASTVN